MPWTLRSSVSSVAGSSDLFKPPGSCCADLVRSSRFENVSLAIVLMNAIWIAIEVDTNKEEQLINAPTVYQVIEHSFCFFFVLEWCIRFMAYRRVQDCLADMWFIFDSFLVLLMVCETWIFTLIMLLSDGISGENLSTLTVLRLLRLLRLSRITRLMRAVPEMMFMIQGLISAMRSVLITLVLILVMVYVFSIAFVQLTRDSEIGRRNFEGVWDAMVTLTVEAILPDQGPLLEELSDAGWYYGLMFFIFLVMATLTMVNMLIGILCEVACRVSAREKEIMDIEMVEAKLLQIVEETLDSNHDNKISKKEFIGIVRNHQACKALLQVGVEASDLVSHANMIYDVVDEDGEYLERKLDFKEFMQMVLKFRGGNAATIRDITNLRKFVKDDLSRLERILTGGTRRNSNCTCSGAPSVIYANNDSRSRSRPLSEEMSRQTLDIPTVTQAEFKEEAANRTSTNKADRLEALSSDVNDLGMRMRRLEDLMEKVVDGQKQMQSSLIERTVSVFGTVKQDSSHSPIGSPLLLPRPEGCPGALNSCLGGAFSSVDLVQASGAPKVINGI